MSGVVGFPRVQLSLATHSHSGVGERVRRVKG